MAVIQRPTKQGNATTYQGKVTAGYKNILASEMDADLDTIYSAWNTGVDTVNIADGAITGSKIAAGAIGSRELADNGVATVDIADAAVTTPKIADLNVTTGKLADGAVTTAKLATGAVTSAQIADGTIQGVDIATGAIGSAQIADGSITATDLAANAVGAGNIADGSVTHSKIGVNAILGGWTQAAVPASWTLTTVGVWTTYVTLPAITTRGGLVLLVAETNLSAYGTGNRVAQRWLRDGGNVLIRTQLIGAGVNSWHALSGITMIDPGCPAGSHTYSYQVLVETGGVVQAGGTTEGLLQAIEIG